MKKDLKSVFQKVDEKVEILFWFILVANICDNFLKLGKFFYVEIGLFCIYLIIRLLNWRDNKAELTFWGIIAFVIGIIMI
jgi:hypothetical protein